METFPKSDLPAELSAAFTKEYKGDQKMQLPDWFWPFLRGELPKEGPPTVADRVMGLSIIWSEAKSNFAYWDLLPGEAWWDERYHEYLPKVIAAEDEVQYWDLLTTFANLLNDGHTSVTRPYHLRINLVMPPVESRSIEGRPMVWGGDVLPRGTEILTVDGAPAVPMVEERAAKLNLPTDACAEKRPPCGCSVVQRVRRPQ